MLVIDIDRDIDWVTPRLGLSDCLPSLVHPGEGIVVVNVAHDVARGEADYKFDLPYEQIPVLLLTRAVGKVLELLREDRWVVVHCYAGIERSPLVVATVLVMSKQARDLDHAYELIRKVRPQADDCRGWVVADG